MFGDARAKTELFERSGGRLSKTDFLKKSGSWTKETLNEKWNFWRKADRGINVEGQEVPCRPQRLLTVLFSCFRINLNRCIRN